jgi:hypothetical protein
MRGASQQWRCRAHRARMATHDSQQSFERVRDQTATRERMLVQRPHHRQIDQQLCGQRPATAIAEALAGLGEADEVPEIKLQAYIRQHLQRNVEQVGHSGAGQRGCGPTMDGRPWQRDAGGGGTRTRCAACQAVCCLGGGVLDLGVISLPRGQACEGWRCSQTCRLPGGSGRPLGSYSLCRPMHRAWPLSLSLSERASHRCKPRTHMHACMHAAGRLAGLPAP